MLDSCKFGEIVTEQQSDDGDNNTVFSMFSNVSNASIIEFSFWSFSTEFSIVKIFVVLSNFPFFTFDVISLIFSFSPWILKLKSDELTFKHHFDPYVV